ncbi:MAG: hypothetical protein OEW58_00080 [Gammaproteobacteria bacterium]|nr:hypothetical protein [Gammaproteobacteria bacterium]
MSSRHRNERAAKKEIKRLFDRSFDIYRLNYKARVKKHKPKALLYGIFAAFSLYTIGFVGGYYGFSNNLIPLAGFAKMVWIFMIPSIVVGLLTYLISKNRMDYPTRVDIREYITELEKGDGLLWKFFPLWEKYDGTTGPTKKALAWSQEKRTDKLDLEDYTDAIAALYHILDEREVKALDNDVVEKILRNFGKE